MDSEALFAQMRDIAATPAPMFWPPAPGWIALAFLWTLLIAAIVILIRKKRIHTPLPEPENDAELRQALEHLQRRAQRAAPSIQDAGTLAELVRASALARLPRNLCAGMHGTDWLHILQEHDPTGFRWTEKAIMLTDAPYRPDGDAQVPADDFTAICEALRAWLQ